MGWILNIYSGLLPEETVGSSSGRHSKGNKTAFLVKITTRVLGSIVLRQGDWLAPCEQEVRKFTPESRGKVMCQLPQLRAEHALGGKAGFANSNSTPFTFRAHYKERNECLDIRSFQMQYFQRYT